MPSVTSIINPYEIDLPEGWSREDMDMYGLRGTLVHKSISIYLKTKKWIEPTEHEGYEKLKAYIDRTGKTILDPLKCNFLGFAEKFKNIVFENSEQFVYSLEDGYCGTYDASGYYWIAEGEKIAAVFDFKTSSSYPKERKDEYGMQMAAYNRAGKLGAEALVVIPLNPKNKCGFGDPIFFSGADIKMYEEMFMQKLKEFKLLTK